jgi:tetratricopeptide (TPR) repeat protein
MKDFNEAIRLHPSFAIAYSIRARTKKTLKDYEGALKDFNEAIRLNPLDHDLFSIALLQSRKPTTTKEQ